MTCQNHVQFYARELGTATNKMAVVRQALATVSFAQGKGNGLGGEQSEFIGNRSWS